MAETFEKIRKSAGKIDPLITGKAMEIGERKGIIDPVQQQVLLRKEAEKSQARQSDLIKKARKAEEVRLAEEKSEVARRQPQLLRGRRTLLGG